MHSFVFFLVASLSTTVAKPLYGNTDNSYNPFFNFLNDAKSSVVEAQDQSNQFPAGVPVLPTLEAKPFEISAASGRLTNLYALPIPIPSPQGVNPVEIGAAGESSGSPFSGFGVSVANLGRFPSGDALFGSSDGGELVALDYKGITIWQRELKEVDPGNNPCSGQDQNLGCCSLTYAQRDLGGDFTCDDFHDKCPANRAYCCPDDRVIDQGTQIERYCSNACPVSKPNGLGQASGKEISDNCKVKVQADPAVIVPNSQIRGQPRSQEK